MSRGALSRFVATTVVLVASGGISGTAAADDLPRLMPSPSVNLYVAGSLDIRLYGPLPRSVGEAKFLFLLTGRLDPDRTTDAEIDFRVLDGQLAFRFAVSDGDVIVEIGATSVSLRGSNGVFVCDLTALSCQ